MAIRRARPMATMYRYYNPATGETFHIDAPIYMKEDFQGADIVDDGTSPWKFAQVSAAGADGTGAVKTNLVGGVYEMAIASASDEVAVVELSYGNATGDLNGYDVTKGVIFEVRFRLTDATPVPDNTDVLLGLADFYAADPDDMATMAWFRMVSTAAVVVETDDAVTDTDDTATGVSVVQNQWYIGRIELLDLNDVRFYLDNVRVGSATKHRMAAMTSAKIVQPYIAMHRASGTVKPNIEIDYVLVAQGAR